MHQETVGDIFDCAIPAPFSRPLPPAQGVSPLRQRPDFQRPGCDQIRLSAPRRDYTTSQVWRDGRKVLYPDSLNLFRGNFLAEMV